MKQRVLSGVQATGLLHLGNYLGAISPWIELQNNYECLFFLADLHAITINPKPDELESSIFTTVALYIAAGLSSERSIIFAQSMVKEHSELAWILNCVTPMGWLKRMTQFKDKAGADLDQACLGLFSYPVLMAADILLYNPDFVPVGDDQKQHLELTRDIAGVVNRKFNKEVFRLPEPLIQKNTARIMSLRDGLKKMSKSDPQDNARINLTDSDDKIVDKLKKAKTDTYSYISYDQIARPEIANLLNIYSSLSTYSLEELLSKYQNSGFAKFKQDLAEIIISTVSPIRKNYLDLINNKDYLLNILKNGSMKAGNYASFNLDNIKKLFGFVQ